MSEHSKIKPAAASAKGTPRKAGAAWGPEFAGSEHPDTARHHIQYDFIMAVSGLSREALDKKYAYLQRLMERAKEELGHARAASNDARMGAMQQNIDELVAYIAGYGLHPKLPNRNGDNGPLSAAKYFALEEIAAFLGEVSFLIDMWYEKELRKVHDELLKLTGLAARMQ